MIILNFHGIGDAPPACTSGERRYWLSRERFEQVFDRVQERSDVRVTFDDGNASDVHIALPLLLARGISATFFIIAGWMNRRGILSAADVRELHTAGMTIGSHGMDHLSWRSLDEDQQKREFVDARDLLEQTISASIGIAACPFGAYDRASLVELRRAGFKQVMTSDRQPARSNDWLQPRYTMRADDTDELLGAILQGRAARPAWLHRVRTTAKQWRLLAR